MKSDAPAGRFCLGLPHLIFTVALGLRLWTLLRLTHSPLLLPAHGDMHFYDDWASEILRHGLSQSLAFYGLPGYAEFLAGIYKLCGRNPFIPGLVQAAADAGVAVLIYLICLRCFRRLGSAVFANSRLIGLTAALGWVLFVPAQAYSVVLMPTALFVFVFWFVVWRVMRTNGAASAVELLLLSVLTGITATAVATVLAVVPLLLFAALLAVTKSNRSYATTARRIASVVVGLALGTAPCWVHNYLVAKDPVLLSAHSGINFWIGNNPEANGYPKFPPGLRAGQAAMLQDSIDQAEMAAGHSLKRAKVSSYWSGKATAYIAAYPFDWLGLIGRKFANFWSAFQYDDLSIITSLREQNVILPGISFGLIGAFALPGLLLACRKSPESRWVAGAILMCMLSLLCVFITERYRLVAVPGLLVFAAFGVWIFCDAIASKKMQIAAIYFAMLVTATTLVATPQRDPSLWALDAYNSGWQALEPGNLALAEKKLALAYAYVPDNAETLFALGNLRFAQNDPGAAQSFYRAVLNFDPKHKGAFNNLGVIALDASQLDEAEKWFRLAEDLDPRNPKTHFLLAKTLSAKNDRPAARAEIETAIKLNPTQPEFNALKEQLEANSQ